MEAFFNRLVAPRELVCLQFALCPPRHRRLFGLHRLDKSYQDTVLRTSKDRGSNYLFWDEDRTPLTLGCPRFQNWSHAFHLHSTSNFLLRSSRPIQLDLQISLLECFLLGIR